MGLENLGPIAQYNSLTDPYLQGYYSKRIVRNHLKQTGLINRRGEIIPEEIWRKRIATKERMEQASRIIANRIVQQAIEIKNLEKAELRRKVDVITKKELVRRIRGKSAEDRNPPKLWPDLENGEEGYGSGKKNNNLISSTMRHEDLNAIRVMEDDEDYSRRYQTYIRKSRSKPKKRSKSKNKFEFKRSFSVYPKPEPVSITVTMLYYGKGINIPFDTQVFDPKDEITVYQQHCGGENLIVFSGLVEDGSKFRFISKRHRQYPFSLTIFINGTYDCRISTCCEYKHRLNARIGGPTGRFAITNVVGDNPCLKCLIERANDEKKAAKAKKNKQEDIQVITEKRHQSYDGSAAGTNEIEVEHDGAKQKNEDNYDSEFDDEPNKTGGKGQNWIVRVYTSDLKKTGFEGTDAKVYVHLLDDKNESERIWLNKSNANSTSKDLFETGAMDEFAISTNTPMKRLNKIRIGHDDSGFASGWHLKKVEVIDKFNPSERYVFECNTWLDKDEGDGKIERVLRVAGSEDDDDQKSTIEIPVRHLSDSDSDDDAKVSSRMGSDRKEKDSRKSSWSSTSLSSRANEIKSKRLTNDDVIAQIKRIDDTKSPKSTSRSNDSSTITDSVRSDQKDTKRTASKQSFKSTSSTKSLTKVERTLKITTKKDSFDFSSDDDFGSNKADSKRNNQNETAKIRKSSFSSRNSVESPKLKNSSSSKKSSTHSIGSLKTPSLSKIQTLDRKSNSQIDDKAATTSKDSIGFDRVKSPSSKTATPTKREAAKQLERQLSKNSNKSKSSASSSDDEESLFNSSINRVTANQIAKKTENSSRNSSRASVNKKEKESSRVSTPKENGSVKNVDLAGRKSKSPSLNLNGKITFSSSSSSSSSDSEEEKKPQVKAIKNEATSSKQSLKNNIGIERPASAKSTSSSSSSSSKTSSTNRSLKQEYKSSESTIPKVKITASSDNERASSRENVEKKAKDMDDSTDSWK